MEEEADVNNILEKLQRLYESFWNKAKRWKELSEIDPPEECMPATAQERYMIAYYNCANDIKTILDDFSPLVSDIRKEN
jgi:hypothetical protein